MSDPSTDTDTGAERAERSERLPLAVYVLALGTFLMGTTEFIVAGLLPELAASFGTSDGQAGLAITTFAVGMIVGAPTMPLLTLRLPRRTTLVLALTLFAVAHVVSALTGDFTVLLVSRVVSGVATGCFWGIAAVVATGLVGAQRSSSALGIVVGGGMLATVLGVPVGSFAGQLIGWRGPFWALAALAVVTATAVVALVPSDVERTEDPTIRSEVRALASVPLWLTLVTCAAINAGVLSVYSFISPLLTGRTGLSGSLVPLALVLFGTGALAGNVIGGRLGDTRPFRTPLVTATVSLLAMVLLLLLGTSPVWTLAAFTLLGAVGLSANPVMLSLVARYGGAGSTLPNAMAPAMFNLGTATGTAVAARTLDGPGGGPMGPIVVGVGFGLSVFVPLCVLIWTQRLGGSSASSQTTNQDDKPTTSPTPGGCTKDEALDVPGVPSA